MTDDDLRTWIYRFDSDEGVGYKDFLSIRDAIFWRFGLPSQWELEKGIDIIDDICYSSGSGYTLWRDIVGKSNYYRDITDLLD